MITFHEVQFPPKIAYGALGGAEFNTDIATTFAGFEQRNINWSKARGRWDVSTGIKTKNDMEVLQAFFYARHGKAYGFRFKDWSDYQAVKQVIGIGDDIKATFQLSKTYISGTHVYIRDIKKPVIGTVKVYLNGQFSECNVDFTAGTITFHTAPKPGTSIVADFEFDVPVRFDTDKFTVRVDGPGIFVWDAIPIIEIRL